MSFDATIQTPKDRLRLQLGDTSGDASTELLEDNTYLAALAKFGGDEDKALLFLAEGLYAKYSQQSTSVTLISGVNVRWRDRLKAWDETITRLKPIRNKIAGKPFTMVRPVREDLETGEYRGPDYKGETWWT